MSEICEATLRGDAFAVDTDAVTIALVGQSALLFVRNLNTRRLLVVERVVYSVTGAFTMRLRLNPTGGTLINTGTAAPPANLLPSSEKKFVGDSRVVSVGNQTIVGGEIVVVRTSGFALVTQNDLVLASGAIVLAEGDSFAVAVVPGSAAATTYSVTAWMYYV